MMFVRPPSHGGMSGKPGLINEWNGLDTYRGRSSVTVFWLSLVSEYRHCQGTRWG